MLDEGKVLGEGWDEKHNENSWYVMHWCMRVPSMFSTEPVNVNANMATTSATTAKLCREPAIGP